MCFQPPSKTDFNFVLMLAILCVQKQMKVEEEETANMLRDTLHKVLSHTCDPCALCDIIKGV